MTKDLIPIFNSAAKHLAVRGLHGSAGDPLPNLMSAESVKYINDNQAAFRFAVSVQRIIVKTAKLKTKLG
jgi:hypothetical protein